MVADTTNKGNDNTPLITDKVGGGKNLDSAALRAASDGVAGKHAATKRPPGRPRKDGRPPGSSSAVENNTQGVEKEATPIDIEFIRKVAASGLSALDSFITGRVERGMLAVSPNLTKEAKALAEAVAMDDSEREMVSSTIVVLAQKYNAAFKYAPEITLGLWLVGYGVRVSSALSEVKEMAEAAQRYRESREKGGNANPS